MTDLNQSVVPAGPLLQVALLEPEIPPNTGNIARLCAATGSPLHLVEPLGFRLTDHAVQRAGLDYWDSVQIVRHMNFEAFCGSVAPARLFFFSTRAKQSYLDAAYRPGDALVFGSEHRGLADEILDAHADQVFGIPMQAAKVRSLNLANSVSIVLYEALRQAQGMTIGLSPGRSDRRHANMPSGLR